MRAAGLALAACIAAPASAQEDTPAPADAVPPARVAEDGPRPPPAAEADFEGAVGPMLSIHPEYQGGQRTTTRVEPGFFIRWGRVTFTNASGFVTRRNDDVMRGLAADLVHDERWRVNLALRIDRGRQVSDSEALTGLQDVPSTIRGRLIVARIFDDGWGATLGTSLDMLGRGGGTLIDFGISRGRALPLGAPWRRPTLSLGVALTAADRRYMRSYFGVTAAQSASTGYAEYSPSAGLRDATVGLNFRAEFGNRWIGYLGVSAGRLLGPARGSPLSVRSSSWGLNGGLAWRF